jgi:hypothetical protein
MRFGTAPHPARLLDSRGSTLVTAAVGDGCSRFDARARPERSEARL